MLSGCSTMRTPTSSDRRVPLLSPAGVPEAQRACNGTGPGELVGPPRAADRYQRYQYQEQEPHGRLVVPLSCHCGPAAVGSHVQRISYNPDFISPIKY